MAEELLTPGVSGAPGGAISASTPDTVPATVAARGVATRIIALAWVGLILSGFNNFVIGLALLEVKPLFKLTALQSGIVAAATLAGMLVGALALGRLADLVGRRTALLIDLALVAIFAIICAFVANGTELITARFLLGLGIGAGYPIGSSYVADVSPDRSRGRLMTLAFAGWGIGSFAAALLGWQLILHLAPTVGWRWMLGAGAVPAAIAFGLVALTGLPESPRWSASKSLEKLPLSALATPAFARITLAALIPWFLMDIAVYGIGLFTPTLLAELGFKSVAQVALGTLILSLFTLAGFVGAGALIDRVGRRPLQIIGFLGMALALAILAFTGKAPAAGLLLGLFAGFQFASNAGPNTTTWIVPAELFPTRLRATGQGAATAFSRLGAVLGVLALPIAVASFGLRATLLVVALVSVVGAVATAALLPETANRPLSD